MYSHNYKNNHCSTVIEKETKQKDLKCPFMEHLHFSFYTLLQLFLKHVFKCLFCLLKKRIRESKSITE